LCDCLLCLLLCYSFFFFQAEDGIRDFHVTGVQTCALPICRRRQFRRVRLGRGGQAPACRSLAAGAGRGRLGAFAASAETRIYPARTPQPASGSRRNRAAGMARSHGYEPGDAGMNGAARKFFIFGAGYSCKAFARANMGSAAIAGTTRSLEKLDSLRQAGIEPYLFDGAVTHNIAAALASTTHLVVSTAPGEAGDPGLGVARSE